VVKLGSFWHCGFTGYAWFIIHGQWLQMSVCLWSYPNQGHTTRVYLGPKHRYSHGPSFLGAKAPLPSYKQFRNYMLRIIFHKHVDADFSNYNIRWHTTHTFSEYPTSHHSFTYFLSILFSAISGTTLDTSESTNRLRALLQALSVPCLVHHTQSSCSIVT
jgi:hypothetical protein